MSRVRVVHYVNQFFANIGSEDKADVPVGFLEGAVGPGKRLQNLLGDSAEIVVTVYCGDDYFAAHTKEALESILQIARDYNVKLLVAGPAFASGRFGFACAEVCHAVSSSLGLDCVSGMHPENPGVGIYKKYMDGKVFALPTREAVSGMEDALSRMAQSVSKLAAGLALGRPSIEGYIPRGFRRDEMVDKSGVERAVDMLLNKIAGRPFTTEIAVESLEKTPVAPRIVNLAGACLALATTSGVLPQGNPDGFKGYGNNQWRKYSIAKLDTMKNAGWDVMHSGYNSASMRDNPNYGVPLDICQELARDGAFARLFPYFYMTSGCNGAIPIMERIGREMVANMKAEGVDAALLVSTWGTDTRSGAVIAKEIEKAGIPVAHITAMTMVSKQTGANRVVTGTKIPHPCGDPNLPPEDDRALRREIVKCALGTLQIEVSESTVFVPDISFTSG